MRRFKIKMPNHPQHVLVYVCKDKTEFDRVCVDGPKEKKFYGLCVGCKVEDYKWGGKVQSCDAAIVYVIEDQVGAGYVAHELTHAVLFLLRGHLKRMFTTPGYWKREHASKIEEYICDTVGWLNRGFWSWWNKHYDEKGRWREQKARKA